EMFLAMTAVAAAHVAVFVTLANDAHAGRIGIGRITVLAQSALLIVSIAHGGWSWWLRFCSRPFPAIARLHERTHTEPVSGRTAVDGVDIRDLDPDAWRRQIAVIFQDFVHYHLPVRENVGFGRLGATDDMLERAARNAGADALIASLAHRWETVLARQYTNG